MTGGRVIDIRTGRTVGRTNGLSETFAAQVEYLLNSGVDFYIVFGRCRKREARELLDFFRTLAGVDVIFDARMMADTAFIFQGHPSELGFAS